MSNRWIQHVKEYAIKHNISYGCAISTPDCKAEYQAKYGNRKKLSKKKEKELMGMEDVNVNAPIKLTIKEKERKKPASEAKERMAMTSEDISSRLKRDRDKEMEERYSMGAEEFHTKQYLKKIEKEKLNRLREMSRMMGEDYRPLQEAMPSESQVKTPIALKIKKAKPKKNVGITTTKTSAEIISILGKLLKKNNVEYKGYTKLKTLPPEELLVKLMGVFEKGKGNPKIVSISEEFKSLL